MKKTFVLFFLFSGLFLFSQVAQHIDLAVIDTPNDDGSSLQINWKVSGYDSGSVVLERIGENGEKRVLAKSNNLERRYVDGTDVRPGVEYAYLLSVYDVNGEFLEEATISTSSKAQWFNTDKIALLIWMIILTVAIVYFIFSAKSGKELYIRKISGLESMDESVGRATEMGRPILFVPGISDLDDMQTIAGLTILGQLAQKAAEYDAELIVPVCRSMVLSTAKEIVKEAFLKAGRPDAYKPDSVFYLTDDQFGFVAGVDGIIVREKPAANFFLGAFYAESLILAETGFASGAIQTAGTAMPSQLPFFVAACDYTLIGEELYAASAYLSKDPHQLGSLKGQDLGKAIFVIVLTIGIILEISGISFLKDFLTMH
ncbi:MAG: hypothetical protein Q7J16_04600 [Candidatus Cloacimonadales bacterium]|nr:hypothetical protein [Candidatus Cloacimonadales bacterium]